MKKAINLPLLRITNGLLAAALLLVLARCDINKIEDTFDDLKLIISLDPVETTVSGLVLDAYTGDLVNEDVVLTIQGPDREQVIDMFSEPMTDITIMEGMITFGIKNGVTPTKSSPLRFSVRAEHYNYLTTSRDVVLTKRGEHQFRLYMTNRFGPAAGVAQASHFGQLNQQGGNENEIRMLAADPASGYSTEVNIEAGTMMKDRNGTNLSGSYEAQLMHFSPNAPGRMFPGGYRANDGEALLPLMFNNLTIRDNSNRKVKTFSRNFRYTLRFREGVVNPRTGQPYQAGQMVNVYAIDAEEGFWRLLGSYPLTVDVQSGRLRVDYEANHLSYTSVGAADVQSCTDGAVININWLGARRALNGTMTSSESGLYYDFTINPNMNQLSIPDSLGVDAVPAVPLLVSVMLEDGTTAELDIDNSCEGTYTLDIPSAELIDVNFSVNLLCYDTEEGVMLDDLPTATIYYRDAYATAAPWVKVAKKPVWSFNEEDNELTGGTLKVHGLMMNGTYIFATTFDSESYKVEVILNESNSNFTKDTGTDDNQGDDVNDNDYNYNLDQYVTDEICG